jgi:hypothetical protein
MAANPSIQLGTDGNWAIKEDNLLAYKKDGNRFFNKEFDFSRATSATRVNKQGLIETVATDKPRIDFLNNTKGHLLLEPQRTNLVPYSEDLTTRWTTSAATITADTQISPDGNQTADKITVTSNSGGVYSDNITVIASTSYTFSFYVKRGTISDSETALAVRNQTAGTFINIDTSYSANADNWTRIEHTFTTPVGCTSVRLYPQRLSNGGQGTIFVWGCQLEAGSATSYIPTSGSAVTRSAETNYQQNVTQVIGQSEGTMYIEFVPKDTSATQILYQVRSSSGTIGQIDIRLTGGNISTLANDGGSSQFSMGFTSYSAGTTYKVAVRYKLNDSKIYINGSSVGSDTSCSFTGSSLDQISFAENLTSLVPVADILDARLYDTGLSDAELQALTS